MVKRVEASLLFNVVETVSWLLCTAIYFTYYNPIGELGRKLDLWNGASPLQWIDEHEVLGWTSDWVPYVPAMIFPYVAVYAMPLAYLVSLCTVKGLDMAFIRRFFITQLCLITIAFLFYIAMPCKTDLLLNQATGKYEYGEETYLGRLCFQHVHQGISLYVAFPSMHTAHSFSIAMAFSRDKLPGRSAAWLLAVITLFSTVMTKAHHPPHLAAGLAVATIGQSQIFERLSRHLTLLSTPLSSWYGFYIAAMAPVLFLFVGEQLHTLSGWNTDVPAMFGFERNPVQGLYGFA